MTEQQLLALLTGSAAITALVPEARIYNGYLPEGSDLPALTFEYVSDQPENTLSGDAGSARVRYSISAWGKDYADVKALEAVIRSTMSGHYRIGTVPLHEQDKQHYRLAIDYSIFQ